MKAPLRVPAQVAEKLRKWLTSELEPHEIYNIDQYAHHVVTIFLNEDLDIEDEPLGSVGDFLKDIYSLRSGKSLEKKKREAVQFLKKLISCDKPVEKEIKRIIDELIVRIETMRDCKPSPRKLLEPLSVNVPSSMQKHTAKGALIEQERRYNKAFPSLSIEIEKNNMAAFLVSKNAPGPDVWQKPTKDESSLLNAGQIKPPLAVAYSVTFSDINEAQACFTASVVFSQAIPDGNLPSPDTMEVMSTCPNDTLSSSSQNGFDGCWKSAFQSVVPTKLYSPNRNSLTLSSNPTEAKQKFSPLVISNNLSAFSTSPSPFRTLQNHVNLFDTNSPKVFLHLEPELPAFRPSPEILFALNVNDLEVANIISWAQIKQEQVRQRRSQKVENDVKANDKNKSRKESDFQKNGQDCEIKGLEIDQNGSHWSSDAIGLFKPISQPSHSGERTVTSSFSPVYGAVGGFERDSASLELQEKGEVWTNDVYSFALRELAKYELKQEKREHERIDFAGSGSRQKIGSIDSGTYPGGDNDSRSSPLEANIGSPKIWASLDPSKSSSLELANKLDHPTSSRTSWRKTPGHLQDEGILNETDSMLTEKDKSDGCNMGIGAMANDGKAFKIWDDEWTDLMSDSWVSMIQQDLFHQASSSTAACSPGSIFQSPEISSHVDSNVSSILQRAYVNSFFTEGPGDVPDHIQSTQMALNCADLEHLWLSDKSDPTVSMFNHPEVVKGITCSNWLENSCFLGVACPFSHPSI